MVKGKGIFVNPASAAAPAKLRVLYEVGPIAYLIEKAGGKSSDGEGSALDIKIPHTEVKEVRNYSWYLPLPWSIQLKSVEFKHDPLLTVLGVVLFLHITGSLAGGVWVRGRSGAFRVHGGRQGDGRRCVEYQLYRICVRRFAHFRVIDGRVVVVSSWIHGVVLAL